MNPPLITIHLEIETHEGYLAGVNDLERLVDLHPPEGTPERTELCRLAFFLGVYEAKLPVDQRRAGSIIERFGAGSGQRSS